MFGFTIIFFLLIRNLYILKLFNLYTINEMKWNEIDETYKNNLLILNLFFIFLHFLFPFTFSLYFFSLKFFENWTYWLCLVLGKCERKKIGRKNGRKEKGKEMNIIFFTCLVIHGKFKGKKKRIHFHLFG